MYMELRWMPVHTVREYFSKGDIRDYTFQLGPRKGRVNPPPSPLESAVIQDLVPLGQPLIVIADPDELVKVLSTEEPYCNYQYRGVRPNVFLNIAHVQFPTYTIRTSRNSPFELIRTLESYSCSVKMCIQFYRIEEDRLFLRADIGTREWCRTKKQMDGIPHRNDR